MGSEMSNIKNFITWSVSVILHFKTYHTVLYSSINCQCLTLAPYRYEVENTGSKERWFMQDPHKHTEVSKSHFFILNVQTLVIFL